jgi:hypothetical protein
MIQAFERLWIPILMQLVAVFPFALIVHTLTDQPNPFLIACPQVFQACF